METKTHPMEFVYLDDSVLNLQDVFWNHSVQCWQGKDAGGNTNLVPPFTMAVARFKDA